MTEPERQVAGPNERLAGLLGIGAACWKQGYTEGQQSITGTQRGTGSVIGSY